eukprot:822698-Pleurochrysis_carterae.AAC.4
MDNAEEEVEQCTYAKITGCDKEGLSGISLRSCYQCGSEGLHHHMCAIGTPELETASAVPNGDSTLCAVCAGVLTLDDVTLIGTDKAAAKLASTQHASTTSVVSMPTSDDASSNYAAGGGVAGQLTPFLP